MNVLKIEPPAASAPRAAAGLWELGAGTLLAYTVEIAVGGEPGALSALRQALLALEAERERVAALLPSLAPEEIAHLLADLLNRSLAGAPAAFALALVKNSVLHVLAGGGGAAYVAPTPADRPIRRVTDGTVAFLLPGAAAVATASGPASRRLQAAAAATAADVVRLPLARETRLVLVSGELEPTLEERLLAALRTAQEPDAFESLLRGPIERTGGALVALVADAAAPRVSEAREGIESELATLRRDLERRLARLDNRLKEVENDALRAAAVPRRSGFAFPGVPALARPKLAPVRRPLPGSPEDLASADDAPAFERGLDVPVASNWSRPLLLVTGGITLILFLSIQLFCPAVPQRRRVIPAAKAVPAAAGKPGAAGAGATQKPPVGVLLVTPSSEPEGTEGAGTEPPPHR